MKRQPERAISLTSESSSRTLKVSAQPHVSLSGSSASHSSRRYLGEPPRLLSRKMKDFSITPRKLGFQRMRVWISSMTWGTGR